MKINTIKHIKTIIKKVSVNLSHLCHLCAICWHAKQKSLALFALKILTTKEHKGFTKEHKGTQRDLFTHSLIYSFTHSLIHNSVDIFDIFDLFEVTKMKTNKNNAKQSGVQHRINEQNNKSPPLPHLRVPLQKSLRVPLW